MSCKNYKVSCKNYKILHFVCLTRVKARKKRDYIYLFSFLFLLANFSHHVRKFLPWCEKISPRAKKSPRVRKFLPVTHLHSKKRINSAQKKRRPRALPFLYITAYNIHDMPSYHFPKGGRQHYAGGPFLIESCSDINASATPRRRLHPSLLSAFRMPA